MIQDVLMPPVYFMRVNQTGDVFPDAKLGSILDLFYAVQIQKMSEEEIFEKMGFVSCEGQALDPKWEITKQEILKDTAFRNALPDLRFPHLKGADPEEEGETNGLQET